MMQIQNVSSGSMQGSSISMAVNAGADSYAKSLQEQITSLQEKMQSLSGNQELSPEEKMERRQEYMTKIAELKQALRQRQRELKKDSADKESGVDAMIPEREATETDTAQGMRPEVMQSMVAADSAMHVSRHVGGAITETKGRLASLESEIKMDAGRGRVSERKEADKADLEKRLQQMYEQHVSSLGDVRQQIVSVREAEAAESGEEEHTGKSSVRENSQEAYQKLRSLEHYQNINLVL